MKTPCNFSIDHVPGLLYAYDHRHATEGALARLVDRSPAGRTLSTSSTESARPIGCARHWEQNGEPTITFDGAASQYAQDQASDAIAYAAPLHQAGLWLLWRGEILASSSPITLCGNWGGSTSNQNALSVIYGEGGAETITVYVTSKTSGGTVHIAAATTAGLVRCGDVVTLTFRHETSKTWTLTVTREARHPGETRATETLSGSYSNSIDSGLPAYGLTLASHGPLAAFGSLRLHTLALGAIGPTTTADLAALTAALAARCDVTWLPYDGAAPLAYSADYADGTHWDDSGHAAVGALAAQLEAEAVRRLGLGGSVMVGMLGDSRLAGTGASAIGTTDARAKAHAAATFSRAAVGPVDDGSGTASKLHFARSGYTTRSAGSQTGHSQRSPHSTSIDAYVGAGKSFNDTRIWTICLGSNDLTGGSSLQRDYVDELARLVEYLVEQQGALARIVPAIVLLDEPVTGSTATGPVQRTIRARNRGYHAAVAHLRARCTVLLGTLNDPSYYA